MLTKTKAIHDPETFASLFLYILDKDKRLIPFRWNRAQKDFHAQRTGRDLILKARQLGFSTYMQGEIIRRATTKTITGITLAHDSETTDKLRHIADRFYNNWAGGNFIRPLRKYANATLTTYPEFDSSIVIATAGNTNAGRGGTYSDFHGSEVAFWPDAEKIIAGAMQGGDPDVVLESTPNGAQGYFYELCMDAMDGDDSSWKLHFYPWWWDDAYRLPIEPDEDFLLSEEEIEFAKKHSLDNEQIKWRRSKQKELKGLFKQEYPEDPLTCFLTSGNSYFGDISDKYTAPHGATWQEGHNYGAGLDWGQTNDYTALIVIDGTTKQMVDHLHIRQLEWEEQRKRVKQLYDKWHLKFIVAEENSIGSVNIEALHKLGMQVIPFTTTNLSKSELMSDLYESIHTGGLRLQDLAILKHELMIFISKQTATGIWRLAAEGDGHDDIVIALGLANYALMTARRFGGIHA